MKQMIRIPFRKLLFVMTLMLGMIIAMSATSLAEGNVLSKGATYNIGDSFTVENKDGQAQYVIFDDGDKESADVLPAGTYTVEESVFDPDGKVFAIPIGDDFELTLGSKLDLTGEEEITGIVCYDGDGTEAHPYEFQLIGRNSSDQDDPVKYMAWDDTEHKLVESTCTDYTRLSDISRNEKEIALGKVGFESWYVVDGNVTISGLLETEGDVNLILTDGSILNAGGVSAEDGSLTICSQSTGSNAGRLITSSENDYLDGAIESYGADIIINGGIINSSEEGDVNNKSRIYCQHEAGSSESNDVVINGGEITAICASGSGIESDSAVTINGGKITAITKRNGEGGIFGYDKVVINGGEITAVSEYLNAGIRSYSDVEINGGTVTARGLKDGKGIEADKVTINGGVITATGNGNPEVKPAILADNELLINSELIVMAGDSEETAKDVTEEYKNDYIEKLTEQWVKISYEQFTVTFVDWQGNTLKTELVNKGGAATAPEAPARTGYTFKVWDKDFSNVTEDMTVTAVYEPIKVTSLRFRYIPKQLYEGSEDGIAVSISPTNALDKSVQYTSSDPKVLTVSEKGRIKAIKEGKATVKVETLDGSGLSVSRSIKVLHTHVWGGWVTTKEPTTEADGEEARTCSGCGETETRAIPKLEHKHDLYLVKGTKVTCTSSGTKDYYECTGCEAIFEDENGEKQTSFGDLDIPATGHNIGEPAKEGDETAATCSLPGGYNMYTRCENCGAVLMVERYEIPIDPDAHVWDEGVVTKEATETETGIMTYTCKEDPSHTKTEVIPKLVSIANAKVVLSASSLAYNGKVRKPSIKTIAGKALKSGTDYTLKWSNASSKNVGSYTLTITGKGKYTGVTKATYKINPKGTSLKAPKKARKAITVKWKRQSSKMSVSRITGYQIQLATDSKFTKNRKTVTVKGYKKVSKKVKKLKAKKKYYIRIRTYKTVSGKKYYSGWSKVKAIKTK